MVEGNVKTEYDWVTGGLDALLEHHGYVREGRCYRAFAPNNDVLTFFCHLGVSCVLLSHLLNVPPNLPPMSGLWQRQGSQRGLVRLAGFQAVDCAPQKS